MAVLEKPLSNSPTSSDLEKQELEREDIAPEDEEHKLDKLETSPTDPESDGFRLDLHRTATFHFRAVEDDLPQ
jgi:hypothetical protein